MTEAEYMQERLEDQLNWHERKSSWNQRRYKQLRMIIIISSVLIPFLSGLINEYGWMSYVVGFLGVVIAASEGRLQVFKYLENWTKYRITAESLRREKIYYETSTGPYHLLEDKLETLVNRTEQILSDDREAWLKRVEED
ncbi:MAG: DUF4231 domain-containing protein [Bacteroidota bacterium]